MVCWQALFHRHVDADALLAALNAPRHTALTPKGFMHRLHQSCLHSPQRIVLPESLDPRIMQARRPPPLLAHGTFAGSVKHSNDEAAVRLHSRWLLCMSSESMVEQQSCFDNKEHAQLLLGMIRPAAACFPHELNEKSCLRAAIASPCTCDKRHWVLSSQMRARLHLINTVDSCALQSIAVCQEQEVHQYSDLINQLYLPET